jgi:ribose-phosphate pyrophosphokinase
MNSKQVRLFALAPSRDFGERMARHLGITLSKHEERDFEDGEHKSRPLVNVRGKDVFVVQSLHGDGAQSVNDKLCRLLFFIGALRDASAQRIAAVVPYLCYARKDRKTKPRDPVTTRYLAALLEAVGADRVVTMDVHNLAAYQNAFRCQTDHLEARKLFAAFFAECLKGEDIAVVSPDVGGVKRAERFREALEAATGKPVSNAFMEKRRSSGVVSGEAFVGDVGGRAAIVIDDLISTGTTMRRAANACHERGSTKVYAAATHGVFTGDAGEVLGDPAFEGVVITDTVPPFRLDPELVRSKLVVLDAASLFASAIERVHDGGSLTDLMEV